MLEVATLEFVAAAIADWSEVRSSPLLLGIILLAGAGTAILFVLGTIAYSRRRSVPYLLVTLVLGALVARTIVGLGTVFGHVPMGVHHLVEHGLDFLIATLLLVAIYRSGSTNLEEREYYDEP